MTRHLLVVLVPLVMSNMLTLIATMFLLKPIVGKSAHVALELSALTRKM